MGALEPQFFSVLLDELGLDFDQYDRQCWPAMRAAFTQAFATKTRDQWATIFEDQDACVYPVLSLAEAPHHRHMAARSVFEPYLNGHQPRSAPVFSRTVLQPIGAEAEPGEHTTEILQSFGLSDERIGELLADGVVEQH